MSGKGRAVVRCGAAVGLLLALGAGVFAGWNLGAPSTRGTSAAAPPPSPTLPATGAVAGAGQKRVVLFGDGMVDGYGLPDGKSLPLLLARARPDLLLIDLGLSHEWSTQLVARVRDVTTAQADAVVLWTGSYDPANGVGAQQYAANVATLLDALKGTRVLLLPPVSLPTGPDVSAYAVELDRVAAQHGVQVLDATSALSAPDWLDSGQELGPRTDAALAALLAKAL